MTRVNFSEIKELLTKKQYQKAILNTHDFVQLALYQTIMSALWFLGISDELHKYTQKYIGVSKSSTLKEHEIDRGQQLGLISEQEKEFIKDLKEIRDSKAAHLSIYFDKEVEQDEHKKAKIEYFVNESEKLISKLLKIADRIGVVHIQDVFGLISSRNIKIGDLIQLGHSKEELFKIIKG